MASKGELPPSMREWSDEVRLLGNDSAHPAQGQDAPSSQDVQGLVRLLDIHRGHPPCRPARPTTEVGVPQSIIDQLPGEPWARTPAMKDRFDIAW